MEGASTAVLRWLRQNPLVFQWTENQSVLQLRENASGKTLQLDLREIADFRLTQHPHGLPDYLNLVFENGTQIVLCHAGFAFAPDFSNTGPLADAPSAVSLSDYYQMFNHLVDLSQDDSRAAEALKLFEILIAVLDGAKRAGLDVSAEETHLEKKLSAFEKNYI